MKPGKPLPWRTGFDHGLGFHSFRRCHYDLFSTMLVLFPCAPEVRETLAAAAGDLSEILFREPSWTVEEYRAALKKAHIIIGEPRNEDFAFCGNL